MGWTLPVLPIACAPRQAKIKKTVRARTIGLLCDPQLHDHLCQHLTRHHVCLANSHYAGLTRRIRSRTLACTQYRRVGKVP